MSIDSFCSSSLGIIFEESASYAATIDKRSLCRKISDVTKAIFNHFLTLSKRAIRLVRAWNKPLIPVRKHDSGQYAYADFDFPWHKSDDSRGLYLFIHGLHSTPVVWDAYVGELQQRESGLHIFTPQVFKKGNCGLEKAAWPIHTVVTNYLKCFPNRPVTLIGTSNGGRVATFVETHLDPEILGNSRLTIVSLAGVHHGTKLINKIKNWGLLLITGLHRRLSSEFEFASESATENNKRWGEKQSVWKERNQNVRHLFAATTEDEQVTNSSSLPFHPDATSRYLFVSGQSHISIVDGVRTQVLSWV